MLKSVVLRGRAVNLVPDVRRSDIPASEWTVDQLKYKSEPAAAEAAAGDPKDSGKDTQKQPGHTILPQRYRSNTGRYGAPFEWDCSMAAIRFLKSQNQLTRTLYKVSHLGIPLLGQASGILRTVPFS